MGGSPALLERLENKLLMKQLMLKSANLWKISTKYDCRAILLFSK